MHFADEAVGQGESFLQAPNAVFERSHIVRHFDNIIEGHSWRLFQLKEQEVGQRRLCSFNLRGEQRLPADVGVKEDAGIRQKQRDAIQSAQRECRAFQQPLTLGREPQRRVWRQRFRDKGSYCLTADNGYPVFSSKTTLHPDPLLLYCVFLK